MHSCNVSQNACFQCGNCKSITVSPDCIREIDTGLNSVKYTESYWTRELQDAKDRSYGIALARMAEALYYARIPVCKFLDIGTGPGYFLSAVEKYLPSRKSVFYGIEKFPPPEQYRVKSENYIIGNIASLPGKFDCGMCIEVLEHLTPNMVKTLFADLARISTPGALYIFNTGMPEYVLKENPAYLDPFNRGHIASYSVEAIKILAEKTGFTIFPIRGKTWAFVAEYMSKSNAREDITDRIWKPVESNLRILSDAEMGSVLKILGLETARAYLTL